jgi:hypothetical protein
MKTAMVTIQDTVPDARSCPGPCSSHEPGREHPLRSNCLTVDLVLPKDRYDELGLSAEVARILYEHFGARVEVNYERG